MTERLFLEDAYCRQTSARVERADAAGIVLDRTVFYARSGGQPGDSGVLRWDGGEARITEAIKGDGEAILHVPAENAALPPPGIEVAAEIDWAPRHALMKMHTAMHLMCAVLPGIAVTGGSVGGERARLDFNLPEAPDKAAIEDALNALIAGDHAVSHEWVEESVLDTNPTLVRTLSVQPPRGTGRLRLVRIGGGDVPVDLQPCGGTHVARTGEIGRIVVQKIENKGKQNRRIIITPG